MPYEEFQKVRDELDDYEDLKDLRTAKAEEGGAPVFPLMAVRKELNI